MKLKFGDTAARDQLHRAAREQRAFENKVRDAIPRVRQRYLAMLGSAAVAKRDLAGVTHEAAANDRDLLREYGAEVLREAVRRLESV
jgi:hypothetical protein